MSLTKLSFSIFTLIPMPHFGVAILLVNVSREVTSRAIITGRPSYQIEKTWSRALLGFVIKKEGWIDLLYFRFKWH
jgi:hypothetical protein